jgi:hypothetical protein
MTEAEIINTVWRHLNAQGRPSMSRAGNCKYRAGELSCAVGCLLDGETAKRFDRRRKTSIIDIPAELIPGHLRPHVKLLARLQFAHDAAYRANWLTDWCRRMHRIAADYAVTLEDV